MFEYDNFEAIPTTALQHAFARSGMSAGQLANNMGWFRHKKDGTEEPNAMKAKRTIGLDPGQPRKTVPYDLAVQIIEACHFDPVDYGL